MDLDTVTDLVPAPGTAWRPGDAWLAGGTWLFSQPQPGLSRLLDLQEFGWPPLVEQPMGLDIAATCTLAELARWQPRAQRPRTQQPAAQQPAAQRPAARWPAAALFRPCCEALLGSFKVWNTATVGGNICLSLPAGPMTSLTAALDGTATIWSSGGARRQVPVADFVTGPGRNVLRPGELLRSVFVSAAALSCRTVFRRASLTPAGRSAAVVIGRRSADGAAVLTVSAATPRPVQLRFAELPAPPEAVAAVAAAIPAYHDDVHGAPAWRAAMTRRLVAEVTAELGR